MLIRKNIDPDSSSVNSDDSNAERMSAAMAKPYWDNTDRMEPSMNDVVYYRKKCKSKPKTKLKLKPKRKCRCKK